MGALLDRAYARWGPGYFLRYWLALLAVAEMGACLSMWDYCRFLGIGGADRVRAVLLVSAAPLAVATAMWVRFRRTAAPLLAWARGGGDEGAARDVWRVVAAAPTRTSLEFGAAIVALTIPLGFLGSALGDAASAADLVLFALGVAIGATYFVSIHHILLEVALRPLVRDVAEAYPPDPDGRTATLPLGRRLFFGLVALSVGSGTLVSGLVAPPGAGAADGLRDLAMVGVVGVTFSALLAASLAATILAPSADLVRAVRRVAGGDLDARVVIVAAEEHVAVARGFNAMVRGLRERESLQAAFGSYVDPDIARRILSDGELVTGAEVDVTVLIVDIRDFTALAERATAAEVVEQLNEFFGLVLPVIRRHGGHSNKLLGDGLLAAFGAPAPLEDHADRAVAAARELAEAIDRRFAGELRVGIGVSSGRVIAGTMGGSEKLDYTLIGDAVNVAARVEQLTKATGDTVLLTESTRRLLRGDHGRIDPRGAYRLRGKSCDVEVHALGIAQAAAVDGSPA